MIRAMKGGLDGLPRALPQAIIGAVLLMTGLICLAACVNTPDKTRLPATISGKVSGANGPVAGAVVQVQGTNNQARTAADGSFTLHGAGLGAARAVTITAWSEGHFINWVSLDPQKAPVDAGAVNLTLKPLFDVDNHEYTWFKFEGTEGSASCGLCHREYKEWLADTHSQSAVNPRFVTMYRGSNTRGQRGQPTQFITETSAKPPDPALPNYGPGFRLDNVDRAGPCAACHTPAAAKVATQNGCAWSGCHSSATAERAKATLNQDIGGVGPVGLDGTIGAEGVTCEFCHVMSGVILDPRTRMPAPDAPGILSLKLSRPPDGQKQFLGTLLDVSREVSYSPFFKQSEFCAACHFGVFGGVVSNMKMTGGTVIYNSYGEWLESAYSDPKTGKTCQDCHMPKKDTQYTVFPERGGVARDYVDYHDHTMLGPSTSQSIMWNAVKVTPAARLDGGLVRVTVDVTNDNTGHAVPTDAPMRSVMLVVEAVDAAGKPLALREGQTLPDWTGDQAGRAGRAYAKILRDDWTGETPTSAFWRKTTIVSDTRLLPNASDISAYAFELPAGANGPVAVNVKLVYRRAFEALARQKGWNDPDIVMHEAQITVGK